MANNFTGDSSCKAHWRFEPGNLLIDSFGTNTLTNINSVLEDTTNQIEGLGCANFVSGTHNYLLINDADLVSGFPLKKSELYTPFTVTMKFCPTNMTLNPFQYLFSKWGSTSDRKSFAICLYNNSGYVAPRIAVQYGYYSSSGSLSTNRIWGPEETAIISGHKYFFVCVCIFC